MKEFSVNQVFNYSTNGELFTIKGVWDGRYPLKSHCFLMRCNGTGHAFAGCVTPVKNVFAITEEEFSDMCGGHSEWFIKNPPVGLEQPDHVVQSNDMIDVEAELSTLWNSYNTYTLSHERQFKDTLRQFVRDNIRPKRTEQINKNGLVICEDCGGIEFSKYNDIGMLTCVNCGQMFETVTRPKVDLPMVETGILNSDLFAKDVTKLHFTSSNGNDMVLEKTHPWLIGKHRCDISMHSFPRSFYRDIQTTVDYSKIPVRSIVKVVCDSKNEYIGRVHSIDSGLWFSQNANHLLYVCSLDAIKSIEIIAEGK